MHEWSSRGGLFILQHLHQWLGMAERIDWERASVDSSLVPAKRVGKIPDQTIATEGALAATVGDGH